MHLGEEPREVKPVGGLAMSTLPMGVKEIFSAYDSWKVSLAWPFTIRPKAIMPSHGSVPSTFANDVER